MRKILIVEDDNDIAMLERDYLEIAGFSTGLAADGDAAAAAALSGEYDLILLDVMLPGRDGYDICRQLRDKIDVPILPRSWKVYKGERELRLPNREFELLKFLAENPNIVFSKEQLFEAIWGYDYLGDSATVTVHIGRIRDKIEDDPSNPRIIETVWGAGYRLNRP
ncbi:response regulator transcription factor [Flavonifractor sp. An10]|uniref:response regulator transcription factor n=1 Tax=Flavonifractor sp. An10 TaxID=1965537 RepID=UPI000B3AB84D|nr:response regulator transcription factor [Flavonifractor sp. An10]OUQ82717.1 hypothetical protein B5E42_08500 [Flavonifractor sp. An10]